MFGAKRGQLKTLPSERGTWRILLAEGVVASVALVQPHPPSEEGPQPRKHLLRVESSLDLISQHNALIKWL